MAGMTEISTPTKQEALLAREGSRRLASHLTRSKNVRLQIVEEDQAQGAVELPPVAIRLLVGLLDELAEGNAVTLVPVHAELTTQQAADFLSVSRPFLVGLLEGGQIPFHKAGTHRRVFYQDLSAYQSRSSAKRREALRELAALSQELDMGY